MRGKRKEAKGKWEGTTGRVLTTTTGEREGLFLVGRAKKSWCVTFDSNDSTGPARLSLSLFFVMIIVIIIIIWMGRVG